MPHHCLEIAEREVRLLGVCGGWEGGRHSGKGLDSKELGKVGKSKQP